MKSTENPTNLKTRRQFLAGVTAAAAAVPFAARAAESSPGAKPKSPGGHYRPPMALGLGGVAIGNGLHPTPDAQALATMDAAWEAGVRFFDTAPFYGYGLSERRFGLGLDQRAPEDYVIATKVGRLLEPNRNPKGGLWKNVPRLSPKVDYSADAVRRSVEDSLQRLGVPAIDIVFIHDLSPDFFGDAWLEHFEVARKGAMPALTKMREEGMIKGWGLGVNTLAPILKTLEVADADVFLSACQYSLVHHEEALETLFPACAAEGVSLVSGAPLNFGFLAGRNRYNYGPNIPDEMLKKRRRILAIADRHKVDLRTAALQFAQAPEVVATVIPGARTPEQVRANVASMKVKIPADFWEELKSEGLIARAAPVPA